MNAQKTDRTWMYLGVALLATAFAFALPGAVFADQCNTDDCDFEIIWPFYVEGQCGESGGGPDPDCSCWYGNDFDEEGDCIEQGGGGPPV